MSKKTLVTDLLFGVQILGALVFCSAQFTRLLYSVSGVSVAGFFLVAAFMEFQLALSKSAHRDNPTRLTAQAVFTYRLWFWLMGAVTVAAFVNPDYTWNWQDTRMALIAGGLAGSIIGVWYLYGRPFSHPMVKGLLGIACKSIPQVLLFWKIRAEGGSGIPEATIIAGHVTASIRIVYLLYMIWKEGSDLNKRWLLVSECANEATWSITTIAWLSV